MAAGHSIQVPPDTALGLGELQDRTGLAFVLGETTTHLAASSGVSTVCQARNPVISPGGHHLLAHLPFQRRVNQLRADRVDADAEAVLLDEDQ